MSVESVRGSIFKGSVIGAIQSSAELYSAATIEGLKSKNPMDRFEGVLMAGLAPIMLPLVVGAATGGAVITKVGIEIDSRKGRK